MLHWAPVWASNNLFISKLNPERAFEWPTLTASTLLNKKPKSKIYILLPSYWLIIHSSQKYESPPIFIQNWRGFPTKKSDSYIQINKFRIKISYMPANAEISLCPHFQRVSTIFVFFSNKVTYYGISSSAMIDKFDWKNPMYEFSWNA